MPRVQVKSKVGRWALDLDRKPTFERVVALMDASHLLRAAALADKQAMMRAAGWTSKIHTFSSPRRGSYERESWTSPDKERTYWFFANAWMFFASKLRSKKPPSCMGCIAEALGLTELHTCRLSKKK